MCCYGRGVLLLIGFIAAEFNDLASAETQEIGTTVMSSCVGRTASRRRRPGDTLPDGDGFTLIEVLVATGLVGLVALAVAPLMLMAVQTSAVAQEVTELTSIGTERMEILRALPFTDAQLAAGGSIIASSVGYSVDPYGGDADRYVRWRITDESASRKHIELVVGVRNSVWGPPREITLETYRTDIQ
jgi:prepilin-type N-terminal cleavage/methylation domain-containing protein